MTASVVSILVHPADLRAVVGLSRSTCYVLLKNGDFPKPRRLSEWRVAWLRSDLEKWAESRPMNEKRPPKNAKRIASRRKRKK